MGNKNSLNRSQKATPTTETMNKQLDESMIVSEACGDSQDQLSKNGFLIIQPFIVGWEIYLEDIGLAQIISVLQSIDEGVMCLMLLKNGRQIVAPIVTLGSRLSFNNRHKIVEKDNCFRAGISNHSISLLNKLTQ